MGGPQRDRRPQPLVGDAAVAVAVAAATLPARRAARVDLLAAIAAD